MIVVTGGIGAGKSTVLKLLREMGAICADADEISREICRKGTPALAEIARHFGSDVLTDDGELNRPAQARLVFSSPDALACTRSSSHCFSPNWNGLSVRPLHSRSSPQSHSGTKQNGGRQAA